MIVIGTLLFALLLMSDGTSTRKELKKCDCTDDSKVSTRLAIIYGFTINCGECASLHAQCGSSEKDARG